MCTVILAGSWVRDRGSKSPVRWKKRGNGKLEEKVLRGKDPKLDY